MPTTTDTTHPTGQAVLTAVVRLVSRAADHADDLASDLASTGSRPDMSRPGPSQLRLAALSLGAQLVASQALQLLPAGARVDEPVPLQADPMVLLRAAETLTRTLPIQAYPPGTAQVIVALCDLITEHEA